MPSSSPSPSPSPSPRLEFHPDLPARFPLLGLLVLSLSCPGLVSTPAHASPQEAPPTHAGPRGAAPPAPAAGDTPGGIDAPRLEREEDATEAVANALLAFSQGMRDGDWDAAAAVFAPEVRGTLFPSEAGPARADVKWIVTHDWTIPAEEATRSREAFLEGFRAHVRHFASVEDVRFKLKASRFGVDEDHLELGIKGFVIGRDRDGHREIAKGTAHGLATRRGEKGWRIEAFFADTLSSQVATRDLFSEVGVPAGLSAVLPRFEAAKSGIVWHGASVADADGDGWIDVFTAGSSRNRFYRNRGDGTFEEIAERLGIAVLPADVTAGLFLDIEGDGDQDLFLSCIGNPMLFENRLVPDGALAFRDVSHPSGVAAASCLGFSAVAGDVNRDGLPDIYVCSYQRYGKVMPSSWHRATNGTPNLLFVNQGGGTFRQEARAWGVADERWSYAAEFADVDGDADPDLYVANDYGENGFYVNQGDHFTEEAEAWGIRDPGNGMGVSFGDVDNDGDLDLHVTNMSSTAGNRILHRLFPDGDASTAVLAKLAAGNTLYERTGPRTFRDVSASRGPFSSGWAWGGGFVDFDNDGWEDLFTTNGFISGASMKDT